MAKQKNILDTRRKTLAELVDIFENSADHSSTERLIALAGAIDPGEENAEAMAQLRNGDAQDVSREAMSYLGRVGGETYTALKGNLPAYLRGLDTTTLASYTLSVEPVAKDEKLAETVKAHKKVIEFERRGPKEYLKNLVSKLSINMKLMLASLIARGKTSAENMYKERVEEYQAAYFRTLSGTDGKLDPEKLAKYVEANVQGLKIENEVPAYLGLAFYDLEPKLRKGIVDRTVRGIKELEARSGR